MSLHHIGTPTHHSSRGWTTACPSCCLGTRPVALAALSRRWKAVLRPLHEVNGSVFLPRLCCPSQERCQEGAESMTWTPPFPGDERREGHTRDIHPSFLEIDNGIVCHSTVMRLCQGPRRHRRVKERVRRAGGGQGEEDETGGGRESVLRWAVTWLSCCLGCTVWEAEGRTARRATSGKWT